ncbi:MAG TPA: ATP-binding protein [Bryobacteraceae bacterium]|jgi:two-component system phosphate regulon sensor histidine kinase PhoR|nr:ATP-binding protein [Bryobacteraceae bacterium]
MRDSIARRVATAAILLAAPLVILIFVFVADVRVRLLSVALALMAVGLAWLLAESLARRINALTGFVDTMLDQEGGRLPLTQGDDELGELTRSVARVTPKIGELVNRLSMELTRREAVLASMSEAVLAVDAQLNVTFCNHSFQKAVGDHGTVPGIPLIRMVRDPALFRVLKQVVDTGEPVRQRLQLSGRPFEVNAALLANSTSRGAIAILHDVSPEEHLERIKRDFIANVSHEFRTPLATIRGYAETLLDGGLEDRKNRRKFVEIIQANGIRLNNIAADLLTLSDLEAGRPEPEPGPISVADAIVNAVRAVEPAARLRRLTLHSAEIPDVAILGYGIRFEQAVLNLLDNAVKFNEEDGEVGVEVVRRPEGRVEVAIWDTGIGIPALDLTRIFERFYRVDKARSRQVGGTGLGLSIVKHAIEQMNGTITVESTIGQGSRFTVSLPEYTAR